MSTLKQLKKRWLRNPEFRRAYASLKPEFAIARQLIAARNRAGLSQAEVARKMGTTQSTVARLESGKRLPSVSSLSRYAKAIGCKIQFRLLPTG
ncbi:MAG: helix-turn-helix transcriptional regulator [Acidobacteria bacterium]|nr:helix-turn-helix transcriptional regulator [Acidobacteriota bacterium]MCZ6489225.1 helix-turn-helix transcriptional regulator [Acidobacteriota bacterium]MCZ6750661.1 helix-turn-helix transcriptional regulator [Acidobacteriota bacterium]